MKKLPIGIQTFSTLIEENYVYVDKTQNIHTLITTGKFYFLARPRRFGKSLLVSTIAEIFRGNKELFDGLAISSLPYDWKKYPVVMISFADIPHSSPELIEQGIKLYLQNIGKIYGLMLNDAMLASEMLRALVIQLSSIGPVVLLIDEYDYPILRHIHKVAIAEKMREILKDFYIVIKGLDPYLKFVLLTGVSKFSKTSIFSGLNNLQDISLDDEYNTLLGYTKKEIITHFEQYLTKISTNNQQSIEQLLEDIKVWYDGYQFTKKDTALKLYNPFSVLLYLKKEEFSNYWFETGTPSFLINLLKTKDYPIQDFERIEATETELSSFEIDTISLKTFLFQTGYLSILGYNFQTRNYLLGYPNKECTDSLAEHIFVSMTQKSGAMLNNVAVALYCAFDQHNFDSLTEVLTNLFANIPYTIQIGEEKYYQTIFYLVLKMIGADIIVEQATNIGRIDAVIQTKDSYFIIEFKINSSAAKALQQIEDKKYFQPYELRGKKIILVGITFDTKMRNVSDIKYKEHQN